jgi:NAD(P)-dependent dehydrogenase (short-subunit alcohol dehydrogenase family)
MKRIVILGGGGNFGAMIMRELARENDLEVIAASRSSAHSLDIAAPDFADKLAALKPAIVIHTVGPYQGQDYHVARACIACGAHYIDLADARAFVAGIGALDEAAKKRGVLLVSGASSVPCLSAALIDHYRREFSALESVDYAITTAQQTNRGLATASSILGYAGKPFTTLIRGAMKTVYGWQDLHARNFDGLGRRWLGNCDIPDLALFPARYPGLKTLRFYAGVEVPVIHFGLWALAGLVRAHVLPGLEGAAPMLLKISRLFDACGGGDSGFYMTLRGVGRDGKPLGVNFSLTARSGDGVLIPSLPSIILAKRLARGEIKIAGAQPCLGLIDRDSYLGAMKGLNIGWTESRF